MLILTLIASSLLAISSANTPEKKPNILYASRCETCKILATELQQKLEETGKSHDVIDIGYSVDDVKPKKRTEYRKSELGFLESTEKICEIILDYDIDKTKTDISRFIKGKSSTYKAFKELSGLGIKINMEVPIEVWNNHPIEIMQLKKQCENMLEEYEDVIADWYFEKQDEKDLIVHLCEEQVLSSNEQKCLTETLSTDSELVNLDAKHSNTSENENKNSIVGNEEL